ncbi:MAG: DUF58 domain-containing protein [Archangiaceae bacterium]|nr:DUF58 domain-containing protein [Archangiaceae bacterium]
MWQRLRAFFKWRAPRTLKVTRSGRTFLVVTVGVGLGALNTGNNLLYLILGLLLSLIVASGLLSERSLRDVQVKRLLPDAAHAGEPFALRYLVTRREGWGFALTLRELGVGLKGHAFVPMVSAAEPVTVRAQMVAERRGPLALTEVEVSTIFPFGLFSKTRRVELDELLLVFPRRGFACIEPDAAQGAPAGDGGNPRRRDGTGDLLGLRELSEGEDARRVHWIKSATLGKLLKVEREREERRQFVLKVAGSLDPASLELRCEEVAALTRRLLSQGHEVGLDTGGQRIRPGGGPGHERRVLSALAWVGFDAPLREGGSEARR